MDESTDEIFAMSGILFAILTARYIRATERDDFIVIISPQYNGDFRPLLAEMKSRRPSLFWLMPSYRTTPDAEPEPEIAPSYMRWEVRGND